MEVGAVITKEREKTAMVIVILCPLGRFKWTDHAVKDRKSQFGVIVVCITIIIVVVSFLSTRVWDLKMWRLG